jgi:hypothetical protein
VTGDRKPFEPADGIQPRWRYCYDLVLAKQPNEEIVYREVEELLDCGHEGALDAMRTAQRHLESDGCQSVRNVPRFGWVVMRAGEHIAASDHHLRKARNASGRALRKITAIDDRRGELSQFEREAADRAKLRATALLALSGRRQRTLTELAAQVKAIEDGRTGT